MSWDAGALHILPELEEDQQHARYPLGSDGVESSKATTHTHARTRAHAHTHSCKRLGAADLESQHIPPDGVLYPESL